MYKKLITKYKSLSLGVRASFWFLICAFIQKGITSITTPIFTRLLTTDEFGLYGVFNSWLTILTAIVSLNLFSGVFVQGLVKFDDIKSQFASAMQGLTFTLTIGWTIVYLAFRAFWNNLFSLSTVQMLSMILIIWTSAVFQFWAVEQRVDLKYKNLVILTLVASICRPALGIILIFLSEDKVTATVLGMVIADVVAYTWLFFVQLKKGKVFFSKRIWKYALLFNLPLIPHYLSMTVLTSSDRIMIRNIVGESASGIYNVAHGASFIMTMFNTALMQTIEPWLYKKIKNKQIKDISSIAYPTFILIATVNLLLMALAPEIIYIFAPKEYHEAIWVVPPLAMSVYYMFAYCFFAVFEFYYEKTRWVLVASASSAICNIILNYICIERFGYMAAGYTTLVCYILYAIFHYLFMRHICKDKLDNNQPYELRIIIMISLLFMAVGFVFLLTYKCFIARYLLLLCIVLGIVIKRKVIISIIKEMINMKKEGHKKDL